MLPAWDGGRPVGLITRMTLSDDARLLLVHVRPPFLCHIAALEVSRWVL
jgi:hypothetical protein